jgi:hypothetical protein
LRIGTEILNHGIINCCNGQPGVVSKERTGSSSAETFVEPDPARRHVIIIFHSYEDFPVPSSVAYAKKEESK